MDCDAGVPADSPMPDADPGQRQRAHARGHAAQERHRAPERERQRHDVAPVEPVGDARNGDAEQRIEQDKTEAREQAHGGVAERKFLFDRLDQDVEDGAVEKIQRVDDGQKPQHIISPGGRPCGCVGLRGHLAAQNRPWFPPKLFFLERAGSRLANEISGLEFDRRRGLIERDADRIAPCGERLELIAQHPPDHQDAAVALAEMLFRMQRHRPLADLRLVIAGELLVLLLGHVPPELAVEFRAHPADIAGVP